MDIEVLKHFAADLVALTTAGEYGWYGNRFSSRTPYVKVGDDWHWAIVIINTEQVAVSLRSATNDLLTDEILAGILNGFCTEKGIKPIVEQVKLWLKNE